MALRGFRDMDSESLQTFAGTAKQASQRLLSSEAACHPDWVHVAVDVEKAFLQGMTYAEMHQEVGEAPREVNFTLPPGTAAILRQVPGYEDFDETKECLHCIKPGTGCKDAPRAFSMKLARVTRSAECDLKPTTWDPELELKHEGADTSGVGASQAAARRLVMILSKHVDDLKIAGQKHHVERLIAHIEKVFGKMKGDYDDFTNCGVHQSRSADGTVTLDQDEYINALIPIRHVYLVKAKAHLPATGELPDLFVSLLGAAAYALLTQHHVAVYIVALQRAKNKLLINHIMQLNAVVLAMQRIKARVTFPAMECQRRLIVHSDGSFKREEETGYGMRGAVHLRMGTCRRTGPRGLPPAQRHQQVTQACVQILLRLRAARSLRSSRRPQPVRPDLARDAARAGLGLHGQASA